MGVRRTAGVLRSLFRLVAAIAAFTAAASGFVAAVAAARKGGALPAVV